MAFKFSIRSSCLFVFLLSFLFWPTTSGRYLPILMWPSNWCKVAVTVMNEAAKSVAINRRRNHRKSRKQIIKGEFGEFPLFKKHEEGGFEKE
jgi:hypothetical protein